jgi:hypothetical protein
MKKLFIILFILLNFSPFARAQDVTYTPDNKLPYEFILLVDYLQKSQLSFAEKLIFQNNIQTIDYFLSHLEFRESFFIIKSEVYKTVLRNRPEQEISKEAYKKTSLTKLEGIIAANKSIHPYAQWLITSIKDDFTSLTNQTAYQAYILQKTSNVEVVDLALGAFERRLNFVLPFVDYFNETKPENWDRLIKRIALNTMERIAIYGLYQMRFSSFTYTSPTNLDARELKFFTKKIIAPVATPTPVSAEAVVEKAIQKEEALEAKASDEAQWVPKDDLLFPTPDPNYIPPTTLPSPVNDWDINF